MKFSKILGLDVAASMILALAFVAGPTDARPEPIPEPQWHGDCPDQYFLYTPGGSFVRMCEETEPWSGLTRRCVVALFNGAHVKTTCGEPFQGPPVSGC